MNFRLWGKIAQFPKVFTACLLRDMLYHKHIGILVCLLAVNHY